MYSVYVVYRITRNVEDLIWQFGPKLTIKKILAEFKFGGGASGPFFKEHCHLSLEILEQSLEFTNIKNFKHASAELALLHALHY